MNVPEFEFLSDEYFKCPFVQDKEFWRLIMNQFFNVIFFKINFC